MTNALKIWKLAKSFTPPAFVVRDFDLTLAEGEVAALVGHSGCGKSTVLSMVAGLLPSTSGGVLLAGREVTGPGVDRGVVFQSPHLLDWLTARENVELGLETTMPRASRAERRERAASWLERVGLGFAAERRPAELSMGMRQRVGLARAFALEPRLLLLDEPFGMLDSITRIELQEVTLELLAAERRSALLVTHDVDEAILLSDRVVMMTDGPDATVGEVLEVPLGRPRSRAELEESPMMDELRAELVGFLEHRAARPRAA